MYAFSECMSRSLAQNVDNQINAVFISHISILSSTSGLTLLLLVEKPFVPLSIMKYWYANLYYINPYFIVCYDSIVPLALLCCDNLVTGLIAYTFSFFVIIR